MKKKRKKHSPIVSVQELINGMHMQYLCLRDIAGDDITRDVIVAMVMDIEKDNPEITKETEQDLKEIAERLH